MQPDTVVFRPAHHPILEHGACCNICGPNWRSTTTNPQVSVSGSSGSPVKPITGLTLLFPIQKRIHVYSFACFHRTSVNTGKSEVSHGKMRGGIKVGLTRTNVRKRG